MEGFVYFILCGLLFSLVLNIIYMTKKHIKSKETKVFFVLLVVNFISLLSEVICAYVGYFLQENSLISHIVTKFYLCSLMTFLLCMTLYIYVICYVSNNTVKIEYYKKLKNISYIIWSICILICVALPITTGRGFATGMSVNFVYLCSTLTLLEWLIPFIKNIKTINKKKILPLILFVMLTVVVSVIQKIQPKITLTTVMEFLVLFIMYHTIENPDMKILKEYHKSKEIAENANNEKAVFLLNISQDIKKPATNINKLAYELKEEAKNLKEDEIIEYGQAIKSQSQEILQSINNVLDISTFETHDLKIIDTKYLPETLFKQLVKSLKINNDVELQVNIDNTLPEMLYGDSIRIKEALKIILDNSIKHTKKGFISISVKSVIKNEICRLIITIEDSGTGIASSDLENIFDKGSLGKAKKIVTLIGGSITVNSQINKGSKFIVVLDQLMSKDNKLLNRLDDRYMNNKRVLIVDYDIKTIKAIKKYLKHYNCVIEESLESIDCLNKIRNNKHYDLIFIREDMPKLTGDDIIFKLNQINEFKTPIVMLIKTNKNTKYDEYVVTPVNKSLLYEVVDDYLK